MTYDDKYTKALADAILAAEPLELDDPKDNGHGGERKGAGRPFGIPNPNGGRKTISASGHTVARNVTLDPDIFQLVLWHANARGNTFSASVNMLLGEALRNHEVDAEANEVL